MSEQIKIRIDGKECTCERGEYLYDVAKRNGIFIPVLCRSDAFDDHRACCRVCIVEVVTRGRSKVVTSCIYPVETECEVFTSNDKIKEERAVLFALLAARAPQSARIAEMDKWLGAGGTGFESLVKLDGEKCILCGLCVQACDSLGTGAISTVNRGVEKEVNTPYGVASAACVGCVSCANVCPTGAIEYTQDDTHRTIWNRDFNLVYCKECGELMGTQEALEHAARAAAEDVPELCDACKKRAIAKEMMQTYRYV